MRKWLLAWLGGARVRERRARDGLLGPLVSNDSTLAQEGGLLLETDPGSIPDPPLNRIRDRVRRQPKHIEPDTS